MKVLSVTIADCKVQTFRAGGPGGQNQNFVTEVKRDGKWVPEGGD